MGRRPWRALPSERSEQVGCRRDLPPERRQTHFCELLQTAGAQGDSENCVAHNGSLIPVPGRDIEVQAWYQGGISIVDFTDPAQPTEIAYFDRGPIDPNTLVLGGDWSAYWYNGNIYASEIARGLDVFELTPSKLLTQNEIDAAKSVRVPDLNVQNQQKIEWPANLVVAKPTWTSCPARRRCRQTKIASLRKNDPGRRVFPHEPEKTGKAAAHGAIPRKSAATAKTPADASRIRALAEILNHLSA